MIYLTEINLHWYEVITFQNQWQTSLNQSPCDTVLRFRSITFKLWEQIFKPSFGTSWVPANLWAARHVCCAVFLIKYVLLWDNFAEQTESKLWLSLPGSWAPLFLGGKSKVRSLLMCSLPVCSESSHLPQSILCIGTTLAWLHRPALKEGRKRLGRASARDTYFWKRAESHQSNSCLWVIKEDRNRKLPCSCPHLTMTYGHRRGNCYWMATADAKSGYSAVWIG